MLADNLRVQFLKDVIIPLCEQYGRDTRAGWRVFQAAYETHRIEYGSFALVSNREERMLERVSYMMVTFFRWLYEESKLRVELRAQQADPLAGIPYPQRGSPRDSVLRTRVGSDRR